MISTLLRVVGIDIKRLAREAAITIVLAMLGAFAAILALALGFVALYLWLELEARHLRGAQHSRRDFGIACHCPPCHCLPAHTAQAACSRRRCVAGGGRSGAGIGIVHRACC